MAKEKMMFEYIPVCVVYENLFKNGEKKVQLRIGRWSVNGIISSPKLEKREFYLSEDKKTWKMGKSKGIDERDIRIIVQKSEEILPKMAPEPGVTKDATEAPF